MIALSNQQCPFFDPFTCYVFKEEEEEEVVVVVVVVVVVNILLKFGVKSYRSKCDFVQMAHMKRKRKRIVVTSVAFSCSCR